MSRGHPTVVHVDIVSPLASKHVPYRLKAVPDECRRVMPELARRPAIAPAAIGRLRGYPPVKPTT